jgi:L-cysteate sulfo-lyase
MPQRFDMPLATFGNYPTPLEELRILSRIVGGPRIWVKRDDLTGVAMGGSKTRALNTLLGDALSKGADTILTCGPVTSNHIRLTAACANRLGLEAVLLIKHQRGEPLDEQEHQGNMLLNHVLGARLEYVSADSLSDLEIAMGHFAETLRSEGKKPYVIPGGGCSPVGALGYVELVDELVRQSKQNSFKIDAIVCASGSGCIQSGLIVGSAFHRTAYPVIGVTINRSTGELAARISRQVMSASVLAGIDIRIQAGDIRILDNHMGEGYAIPTAAAMSAIKLLAKEEGLLLDPCYTGKAMAGVLDLAKTRFNPGQNIVFIHTGGLPGMFNYARDLSRL